MAFEIVMPRLGWTMESGALAGWRKQDGDLVEAGEILFEVESDKAIQEVEALESGILRIPPGSPALHEVVPVGALLAYLLRPGEPLPFAIPPYQGGQGGFPAEPLPAPPPTSEAVLSSSPPSQGGQGGFPGRKHPPISPRAMRVARELGLDWRLLHLQGSGRSGRIVERDIRQAAALATRPAPGAPRVSPVARRAAEGLGVDLNRLAAQLPGKRIERADVESAAAAAAPVAPSPKGKSLPVSSFRRITAERMAASAHTAAPVTLTTEANATELVRLRDQLKEDGAAMVPSFNAIFARLAALALSEHPALNASFAGEASFTGEAIFQSAEVNLGLAVDTERGLLVPVLRSAQAKSLVQIAQESEALIEKARSGQLTPDDLRGGTFTLTNLGMYEIDAFTPIINLPECAILGVGRIQPKQVVVDAAAERVAIRQMVFLSLTFDHRLVDGAPAARFLQRVKQYVEKPYLWLVSHG